MGMFDWVNFEYDCPICGSKVTGFQSKDGPCELKTLEYWQVNNFYTHCDTCDYWVEFKLKKELRNPYRPIEDYEINNGNNP